jgi:hypothetical protein
MNLQGRNIPPEALKATEAQLLAGPWVSEAQLIGTAMERGVSSPAAAAEMVRRLILLHGGCNRIQRSQRGAAMWRATPTTPSTPASLPRRPPDVPARRGKGPPPNAKGPPRAAPPFRRRRADQWRGLYSRNVKE